MSAAATPDNVDSEAETDRDWLSLNVGGKTFMTTRATICADKKSMLAKMFQIRPNSDSSGTSGSLVAGQRDKRGAFLLDADPIFFRPVLNFLRTGQLVLGSVDPVGVLMSAQYFQIEGIIRLLDPEGLTQQRQSRVLSDVSERTLNPDSSAIILFVLFSGILYVTGVTTAHDKEFLQQPAWVAGVEEFQPGGTDKFPCYQIQSKSGSCNRGHALELISRFLHAGWCLQTSSHDQRSRSDNFTLTHPTPAQMVGREAQA